MPINRHFFSKTYPGQVVPLNILLLFAIVLNLLELLKVHETPGYEVQTRFHVIVVRRQRSLDVVCLSMRVCVPAIRLRCLGSP